MLIATLMGLIASQQAITFDYRAAPAPELVSVLGEQIGVPMNARPNLEKDILIVRLKDATQEDAMSWIAEAVEGEWVKDKKGVLWLERSKAVEEEQKQASLREKT